MVEEQIAWAAGIFEGGGSILSVNGGRQRRLALRMTDEDVVRRWAAAVNANVLGPYSNDRDDGSVRKQVWVCHLNGRRADRMLARFWPWLGERRRGRAVQLGFHPGTVTPRGNVLSPGGEFRPRQP